jgi:uncharacterized protein YkwD
MKRPRLVAAVVTIVTLVGAVAVALTPDGAARTRVALAQPITTTTSELDFGALVESGVSPTLPEEERQLTNEATNRATSTTTSSTSTTTTTTTTAPPTTTAPNAPSPSKAPPQTSPPTTNAPTTAPPSTVAVGFISGAESDLASRINSLRSSNGRPGLSRDGSLDSYARSWAQKLAGDGGLSHSNLSDLLPPWNAAGENVAVGGTVGAIFDALVSSSGHRENMLGDFSHMGVGVYRDSSGALWTAHVFTR